LGDPFPSNLEAFPWFKLQITMDFERDERGKREGRSFTVWQGRAGEMIEEREGRRGKKDSFYCGPTG
jgi:hypothetical protein